MKNLEKRLQLMFYRNSSLKSNSVTKASLQQKNRDACRRILPFVTQYHSALPSLKILLKRKWHLIQNQPYFTDPPLISQRKIPEKHSV